VFGRRNQQLRNERKNKSLRNPLILLFIALVLIPVSVITILLYRHMNELVTNRVVREQQEATRTLIRLFSDTQREAEAIIRVVEESPHLSMIETEEDEEDFQEILRMLRDGGQYIEDIYIYNPGGQILGTTDAYWISAQAQYWRDDALANPGELTWTEPYMDNRTGNMTLAALLYVSEEVGIIGVSLDFEEIAREVDTTTIGYSGYAFVYSSGGYRHFTHNEEEARRFVRRDNLFINATEERGLLYDELNNYSFLFITSEFQN
jgi:methyl-accepting chemotaxis protein